VNPSYARDLELARQCAAGDEAAWQRFILEFRPILYRAADALDPGGGARELADTLYADLYGLAEAGAERRSLFRYYQGRSSLATWLRAVLSQRFVDRVRAQKRFEPLPDEDRQSSRDADPACDPPDPHHAPHAALLRQALLQSVDRLDSRDRLRLGSYYVQDLTLAQIGRLFREHEATASRHLTRIRRTLRDQVERQLRDDHGLSGAQIAECFAAAAEDAGPLDLAPILGEDELRKKSAQDRSV
jgi:RNA polymerase sigma factor (sigma-70 family)